MIIVTTESISDKELITLGFVRGATVESTHMGRDLAASFKTLVGGEIKSYTEMLDAARKMAIARMVEQAEGLNADAIVGLRFSSASVMQGAAEIMAYGTAVKFK